MLLRIPFFLSLLFGLACALPVSAADPASTTNPNLQLRAEQRLAGATTSLKLMLGEVKVIPWTGMAKIARVAIGDGKIISANLVDHAVIVIPEKVGKTDLKLWTETGDLISYTVSVVAVDLDVTTKSLTELLSSIPTVKVERVGELVLLTGTANKQNLPRIEAIAKLFPPTQNIVTEDEVTMRRMVSFKVQIVEMRKSVVENIGIAWDKAFAGPSASMIANWSTNPNFRYISPGAPEGAKLLPIGGSGWRPFIGLTTSINSMINLSVNNGDAYILATPELSARSGGKAEFLAGGQVPIVMPATAGAPPSVTFKDYGITLKVEPVTDANNNVTTVIKTEMSSIDNSVSVNGNPGFLTRKTDTEFNVQSGQTIVLSGLVNTDIQKDISKVAGIGDLPILGELFKSNNFRTGRTDLVIFVTPTVIDPASNNSDERLKKARDIEDKFNSLSSAQGILN